MDKRGISPLIATVLLVGFTIVLAAYLFSSNIGGKVIKTAETMQESSELIQFSAEYSDVNCTVDTLSGDKCYSLLIKNEESKDVGYIIRTIGNIGSDVYSKDVLLSSRESKLIEVTFNCNKVGCENNNVKAEVIPITFTD